MEAYLSWGLTTARYDAAFTCVAVLELRVYGGIRSIPCSFFDKMVYFVSLASYSQYKL